MCKIAKNKKLPIHRQEENIKMDLKEMGFECVDWIHEGQGRNQWLA